MKLLIKLIFSVLLTVSIVSFFVSVAVLLYSIVGVLDVSKYINDVPFNIIVFIMAILSLFSTKGCITEIDNINKK